MSLNYKADGKHVNVRLHSAESDIIILIILD